MYVANCAQAAIIPNANKSEDAQPDYRVMAHVTKTRVDQIIMLETSGKEYVSLALAAPEFGPRKCHGNLGGNCLIGGNFFAMILKPTD